MNDNEQHIAQLFTAELQFRLASAVRIATTTKVQPLELPLEWSHGRHSVGHDRLRCGQTKPNTRRASSNVLPPT